jgi:hypothetical protein
MATYPDYIELTAAVQGSLLSARPALATIGRQLAELSAAKSGNRDLPVDIDAIDAEDNCILEFGPKSIVGCTRDGDVTWLRCQTFLTAGVHTTKAAQEVYTAAVEALAGSGVLRYALLTREGSGRCLPLVPVALLNAALVAIRPFRVDEVYDRPADFWAAFDRTTELGGGVRLATRGLEHHTNAAYLAHVMDGQWAMARAAKAGQTGYHKPAADPEELPVYTRGERRLNQVGIVDNGTTVEFACYLKPGDHIQGHEIFDLWYLIKSGKFADGSPVGTVRIVFGDRWMAEAEKRPLLDIGCRVYAMVASGDIEEIRD